MTAATVAEVMTSDVVTATPDTSFKQVVGLLDEHAVSAVPIVDRRSRLLGVVSEADLLVKESQQQDRPPGAAAGPGSRRRWTKAHATTAADVMTTKVQTIEPDAAVSAAARRLLAGANRRLFVVEDDKVVGVVSRRDVLKVFLADDDELRDAIVHGVFGRVLWVGPDEVTVVVADGEATLSGTLERRSDVDIAASLTARIPGVVAVHNDLTFDVDDAHAAQDLTRHHERWRRSSEGFTT